MIYLLAIPAAVVVCLLIYMVFGGPELPPETEAAIKAALDSDLTGVVSGETGFAVSGDVRIWYKRRPANGASQGSILLNMGMGGDALCWPPSFLRALTDAGYDVIRYDYRGTGMSDWITDWDRKQPYTLDDMAGDALNALDAAGVDRAHLVEVSMGGMIAQEVAIADPERVLSLTLLSTSGYATDPDLPGMTSKFFFGSLVQGIPLLKYRLLGGERNLIKERIAKTIVGTGADGVDLQELAELVLYDLRERRGVNLRGILQHQTAITVASSRYEHLSDLAIPTLVVHGTADQFLPIEHGEKLVELIPNTEHMWLEDVGHIFPYPYMATVNDRIFTHFAAHSPGSCP